MVSHPSAAPEPLLPLLLHNPAAPRYVQTSLNRKQILSHLDKHFPLKQNLYLKSYLTLIETANKNVYLPEQEVETGNEEKKNEGSKTTRELPTSPKHLFRGHQIVIILSEDINLFLSFFLFRKCLLLLFSQFLFQVFTSADQPNTSSRRTSKNKNPLGRHQRRLFFSSIKACQYCFTVFLSSVHNCRHAQNIFLEDIKD